jgi:hypothetical protein
MRHTGTFLVAAAVLATAAPVEAKNFRYRSAHPGRGGFCAIDVPHVHAWGPSDPRVYRVVDGEYYFVGDPVAFGYDGPKHSYYGSHPVVEAEVSFGEPVYCYLEGPHFHWYAPPPQTSFEMRAGVYWYVGNFEPVYYQQQPRYAVINDAYRPIQYERPVAVVTDAPPGWRGVPPGHRRGVVAAQAVVAPPQVQIGLGIHLGGPPPPPPVVVHERVVRERVYVAEPPGHAKRHWGDDNDQGHGKWKDNGRHKGRWKD